jgi:hypothetical protein
MSLKQPEQGAATEDIEVQQHQQRTQAIHDLAEESARKAAKITKALADPKVSSKGFVVDGSGQVIPVINLEDGRNLPSQTIESPRFQLPSGAPPPAAVAQTDTKKRSNRVDIPPATTKSNAKTSSSPAKSKDEQFYTSDTTEIPMNIQFAPVGGVACKDQSGPVRRAELKIPASKMLRSEFTKLVNAFDATAATTVSLDDEGGPKDLLSKTAPPVLDKQGETRPGTERAGSVTARVPTVPRRLGDKTPNSARKPSTHGVGGTSPVRLPGTVSPELIPGSAYQIQHPALPPQKPKVTDPRQRPHFHAKPTHDSVATVTAQKTSSSWKETSSKVHAVGIDKVTVRYSIDEPNEGDA